jgi:effector-binding domain-containing protein
MEVKKIMNNYYSENYSENKEKLNKLFKFFRKTGYVARQNFACCGGCACAELSNYFEKKGIPEGDKRKAIYYHSQDTARFRENPKSVMLGWNGDGTEIVNLIQQLGLKANWNGTDSQRIEVLFI